MIFRAIKSAAAAISFYLLYYICQYLILFLIPGNAVLITVIGSVLFAAASFFVLNLAGKQPLKYLGITRLKISDSVLLLLFGAALNIICTVVIALIPFPKSRVEQYAEASAELIEPHIILSAMLTLIIAPTVEELLFRGLVYRNLRNGFNAPAAVILSALLFGLAHNSPIWVLYAAFFGAVLAYIYEKYSILTASVLFHLGFNLLGFVSGEVGISVEVILVLFPISVVFSAVMLRRIYKMNKQPVNLQFSLDL